MENNCYMTLITQEKYIPCTIRNAQGLKYLKSKYPLIAMVPKFDLNLKKQLEDKGVPVALIDLAKYIAGDKYLLYADTINKFKILTFTEYDKICFLDADMLVLFNLDNEFDKVTDDQPFVAYSHELNSHGNGSLTGEMFICKPNPDFYNKIKEISILKGHENDEDTLQYFFPHLDYVYRSPTCCHFGGRIKPWQAEISGFKKLKDFIFKMNDDDFNKLVDNELDLIEYRSLSQETISFTYFKTCAFVAFLRDEEDLKKIFILKDKIREQGSFFPFLVVVEKKNKEKYFPKLWEKQIYPRCIKNQSNNNILNLFNDLKQELSSDYDKILFIANNDFNFDENIDFIFNKSTKQSKRNQFFEKYKNDLILFQYTELDTFINNF